MPAGHRRRTRSARSGWQSVDDPHVPLPVDVNAVRKDEHLGAEAPDELSRRIELHYDGQVRSDARVGAAAIGDPDRLAVDVRLDGAYRSPHTAVRQLKWVANARVWIRSIVGRRDGRLRGESLNGEQRDQECMLHARSIY